MQTLEFARFAVAALSLTLFATASYGEDCSDKVKAAFEKQHAKKMFRVSMSQPTAEGPVEMTVDYHLPDKMLQTVVAPHMPGEQQTMLVGDRAFAGSGGGFEELLPQFTQSVVSEFLNATDASKQNYSGFACVGDQALDGKTFVAYRTTGKADADPAKTLARTIYVDKDSGLPMFNIVAALAGDTSPVMKATYTYPTDIEIIAPTNAPVQKLP